MKVILVDDERLALNHLEQLLQKLDMNLEIIGKYTNPLEARSEIIRLEAEIVFLDIHLPELNGIELAEQIIERKPRTQVVFVTAFNDYAVKAFELNAVDYIMKPISKERLAKTVERITARAQAVPDHEVADSADRHIRINMFRQVSIETEQDGRILPQWRTTKAQELFMYLLQHRGQLIRKSTLTDMLWPEYQPDKVYAQLYTTIYHIRKTLQPFGDHIQIVNTTEGYILQLDRIELDIEEWEARLRALPPISAESIPRHEEVSKMYTGDYLQEYGYWWAEGERQRLRSLRIDSLFLIADWYAAEELWNKAAASYQTICDLYPLEEKAYLSLMRIFAAQNNPALVERHYNLLRTILREELNVQPSGEVLRWYESWAERRFV
ncbi:response regulator [Paenibacillus sp. M1]|uniref:Response regulator n=1 Tax=Paenibacillus haidiansis TaxID=1574488 RepID=A0ABU7VNF9_9BACL